MARRQPRLHARDLALAERRRAEDLAREPAVRAALELHRDQFVDAEGLRDRPRHELVGRRDDGHQIALLLVAAHQRERLRPDGGLHHLAHEPRVRRSRLLRPLTAHGLGGEAHVVVDVERARLVVGKELVVALAEVMRIGPADVGGEDTPGVVRVDRQQGVVEVE